MPSQDNLSDGYRLAMSFLRELAKAKREGK